MKQLAFLLIGFLVTGAARGEGGVVVIANASVPVSRVDASQATQIFLKQIQTWPDGSAIHPIDIKDGSPLRDEFYRRVANRSPGQLRAFWARQAFTGMGSPPRQAASPDDVHRIVQTTPGAIGYVSRRQADASVKVVLDPR